MMSRKSAATDGRASTSLPELDVFGMSLTFAYPRGGWGRLASRSKESREQTGYQIIGSSLATRTKIQVLVLL